MGPVPPPYGGVATNMFAIHNELQRLGHESTMIDVIDRNGRSSQKDVFKPRSPLALLRFLASKDFDLIHYHIGGRFNGRLAVLTLICGLLPGKRSVVTFHSGGFAMETVNSARPFSMRGLAFHSVDLLIGVNDQILEMFKAYGLNGTRTRKILPFDLKRPDPNVKIPIGVAAGISGFDPLLLSVGALEPEYNNEFLVRAMPRVLDRHPNAGLVIIGSGSLKMGLDVPKELREHVLVTGDMEHEIVLHLIERADALLRITDFDGDAISVREAIYLGTPVIASDNGMRPEGLFLIKRPFDVNDLVGGVQWAKNRQFPGQITKVSELGNAAKVIEIYKELLG